MPESGHDRGHVSAAGGRRKKEARRVRSSRGKGKRPDKIRDDFSGTGGVRMNDVATGKNGKEGNNNGNESDTHPGSTTTTSGTHSSDDDDGIIDSMEWAARSGKRPRSLSHTSNGSYEDPKSMTILDKMYRDVQKYDELSNRERLDQGGTWEVVGGGNRSKRSRRIDQEKVSGRNIYSSDGGSGTNRLFDPDYFETNSRSRQVHTEVIVGCVEVNLGRVNPLLVGKEIDKVVGRVKSIRRVRDGKLCVECFTSAQAQKLKDVTVLGMWSVNTSFFEKEIWCKGVISGIPLDVSEEEIKESLVMYNVTQVKRLKRRVDGKFQECMSVVISFQRPELPYEVSLGYQMYQVRTYVPAVIRCFKCQRLGHVADKCKGQERCVRCGGMHKYEDCSKKESPVCCRCGGKHSAAYAGCETIKNEKKIQYIKSNRHISYAEAAKQAREEQRQSWGEEDTSKHGQQGQEHGTPNTGRHVQQNSEQRRHNTNNQIQMQTQRQTQRQIENRNRHTHIEDVTKTKNSCTMVDVGVNTDKDTCTQTDSSQMYISPIQLCTMLVHIFMEIFSTKSRNVKDVAGFISQAVSNSCGKDVSAEGIVQLLQGSSDGKV